MATAPATTLGPTIQTTPGRSRARAWWLAVRPRTLVCAAAPVALGTAIAIGDDALRIAPALAALIGALALQIGANLVNDVEDFRRGADDGARRGPTRVVAAGLLTAAEVRRAAFAAFAIALLPGAYLVAEGGWPIAAVGIAGIGAAVAYTAGPQPLAYVGLGDLFVIAFFGVLATAGAHAVQAGAWASRAALAGLVPGLAAAALLTINNLRDREGDERVGKRTLVVRVGAARGRAYLGALWVGALALPLVLTPGWLGALPLATSPVAYGLWRSIRPSGGTDASSEGYAAALAGAGRLLALVCVLWIPAWVVGS